MKKKYSKLIDDYKFLQSEKIKELKTVREIKSCGKSCGPSDFCKGGKCDKNGCYY